MFADLATEGLQNDVPQIVARIRKGEAGDAARMNSLLQNHYNWINVNHSPLSVVQRKTSLSNMRDAVEMYPSVVAEIDDMVVGFAITFPQEPSVIQLRLIYVDDAYRNRGLATAMIPELEEQILASGFGMVMATASRHWYPGKALPTKIFQRSGFSVTHLDPDTEMYLHPLGATQPRLLSSGNPQQLFGIRSIGYPTREDD